MSAKTQKFLAFGCDNQLNGYHQQAYQENVEFDFFSTPFQTNAISEIIVKLHLNF